MPFLFHVIMVWLTNRQQLHQKCGMICKTHLPAQDHQSVFISMANFWPFKNVTISGSNGTKSPCCHPA
jgi:hypothetical protein